MKKKKLALRLAQILVVLVGISFVTFLLTYLSPGDPVRNMYTAAGIMPTEELVAETREELGLNDPLPTQYLRWLRNCLGRLRKILYAEQAGDGIASGAALAYGEADPAFHGADAASGSASWYAVRGV